MGKGQFPPGFVERAIIAASHTHDLGDRASIILAQAALETGWFSSRLWREGQNPFGMQSARLPENRKWQTGGPVDLAGVPHAGYAQISDAFKDRERLLRQFDSRARKEAPELVGDLLGQLGRWWAPPDPRYPSNSDYVENIKKIIRDYDLDIWDTKHPAPREDLRPTAPYKPVDPRDNYQNLPGVASEHPRPGLPYWLVAILALVAAFFAGAASSSWVGILLKVIQVAGS